jgi:hypothetical protein
MSNWNTIWNNSIGKVTGAIIQIVNLTFSYSPLPDVVDLIILLALVFLLVRAVWRAFAGQG